jgi:DNA repair protein RecO (recombination protein O)
MFHKTRGIVINNFPYNDSSSIVKIYTELLGIQSYIISGGRSKKSNVKINLFQPLTLVELVVSNNEKKGLQRIKELRVEVPFKNIPNDIIKSSMVLFINEIIYKSIEEEEANSDLFEFIRSSLLYLDLKADNCNNFHLLFLMQLSKFLGFYPQNALLKPYFNLKEGIFQDHPPTHPHYISGQIAKSLYSILGSTYESSSGITITNNDRRELLGKIIEYYEFHLNKAYDIKSHHILEEVIS